MDGARLSKSLIQFSVDGRGCVPSLLFDLRPSYGEVNEDSGDLLQKALCTHCCTQFPRPCSRPPPLHPVPTPLLQTPGHSQASLGQFLVGSLLLSPGSWYAHGLVCALQEFVSPVLSKFCNQIPLASKSNSPRVLSPFARSPGWEICFVIKTIRKKKKCKKAKWSFEEAFTNS